MATMTVSRSSVEGLQRFHDLAESLLELHDGLPQLLEHLEAKAESLGVHRADVQSILLGIIRDKSPLGVAITRDDGQQLRLYCPRCESRYEALIPTCQQCGWQFCYGLGKATHNGFRQIEIARAVWRIRKLDRDIGSYLRNNKIHSPEEIEIALKWFERDAEMGFMQAQDNLGYYYRQLGDQQKAFRYYQKAAAQGYDRSENILGVMLEQGDGCEKNLQESVRWYKRAAEKGLAVAQFNLANCYYSGRGVAQDFNLALQWYCKAAEQQYASAQNRIGVMYHDGKGVGKDYQIANRWFVKAALNGNAAAIRNLAYDIQYCFGELTKNLYIARSLYTSAAKKGYKDAEARAAEIPSKAPWKLKLSPLMREQRINDYQETVVSLGRVVGAIDRFDMDDEIIWDSVANLTWQRTTYADKMTWHDANDLVHKSNREKFSGYDDWRLPERDELKALLAIGETLGIERYFHKFLEGIGFEGTKPGLYWTGGSEHDDRSYCINLKYGGISLHNDYEEAYTLVVRQA